MIRSAIKQRLTIKTKLAAYLEEAKKLHTLIFFPTVTTTPSQLSNLYKLVVVQWIHSFSFAK